MIDPIPRAVPEVYQPLEWPAGRKIQLSVRDRPLDLNLVELLERRQTRRSFRGSLPGSVLGEFLWLACRNRSSRLSSYGFDQESRVYPSAGAVHPIHVLCSREGESWMRYDPFRHELVEVAGAIDSASAAWKAANGLVKLENAVLFGLVAEFGKTAAKYENYESLVWRDSGVVLGYMSLIAEALDLSFCPLGISGHPHLVSFNSASSALQAAGLAALGVP